MSKFFVFTFLLFIISCSSTNSEQVENHKIIQIDPIETIDTVQIDSIENIGIVQTQNEEKLSERNVNVECILHENKNTISCKAKSYSQNAVLKWSSNVTSKTMSGTSNFNFQIETPNPRAVITLEVCQGDTCDKTTSEIDMSFIEFTKKSPDQISDTNKNTLLRDSFFNEYECANNSKNNFSKFYPIRLIEEIEPMGKLNAGSGHVTPTDHLYIKRNPDAISEDNKYFILSPSSGHIVRITRQENDQYLYGEYSGQENDYSVVPDHRILIMHSCNLMTVFIHLGELHPTIIERTGKINLGDSWSASDLNSAIKLNTGDPIARFGDNILDWSVHDSNMILDGFLNPERYRQAEPWKIHTVDPFQYFNSDDKELLLSKVKRIKEPLSGKIDYDIEGKIIGNWFLEGTDYLDENKLESDYWAGHLAIGYHHIYPDHQILSVGRNIGIDENIYNKAWGVFRLEGPDIATIGKVSNEIEYKMYSDSGNILGDDLLGRLLISHLGNRSLQVEVFSVNSNNNVLKFTDNSKIYIR
ncbi:MAG: hypothetical protein CL782_07030 [Chloroflexi bacterium]|nr:hypothetical protein [Chloroflexota bacterium]|tara:strand:+ start:6314 stop:7897 length:1584 start_codon:yes stop_codon:yes gene_type:complete